MSTATKDVLVQYKYLRAGRESAPGTGEETERIRGRTQEHQLRENCIVEMANAAGKVHIALLLFLSASVPCCSVYNSGECFFNTKGSCVYMGQVYGIGESWTTSDCFQCVCMEPFGVGCCDHGSKPVDYPDWCEIIRKPDSCTSVAVMRANHKLPCLWGRGRLRAAAGQPWKSDNNPLF